MLNSKEDNKCEVNENISKCEDMNILFDYDFNINRNFGLLFFLIDKIKKLFYN
ncbi:MAG: hypothetical protein ACOC22_01750 [bacterium]